jgi:hypothetical protein
MKRIKFVKKDCGIHYGATAGPCAKCKLFASYPPAGTGGRQYGGNNMVEILSEVGPNFPLTK